MGTTIRTLRLETSKRGRPSALHHPSSAGSSQRILDLPVPKELGLLSLKRRRFGSYNRKKESRMAEAERQRREKPTKIEQRKVQGPQAKQTASLASPVYIGQAQGWGDECIKRGSWKNWGLSSLFLISGSVHPHSSRVYYPSFFLIKLRCNTGSSFALNFCCGETELRKLQTPPTCHIHKCIQLLSLNFIFLL